VRRALRRLASILLTLFATSLLSLWALSQLSDELGSAHGQLPSFFNPAPRSARGLAESSIAAFVRGRDEQRAARELNRLGGAALPHVLSQFDALSPAVRGKLALALSPIAGRMGIASPNDFATPEAAVLFWTRFWQDRAIDFKPQLVRRLVTRLAEKSSVLRSEDVVQLDTYALPELIGALESAGDREGVQRAHRLTVVLAHVTGQPWAVERAMTPEQANRLIARWRRFWLESGADFSTPEGARQVTAMFAETRYGHWIRSLESSGEHGRFGLSAGQLSGSLARGLAAVLVALALAALLAHTLSRRGPPRLVLAVAGACLLLASAPVLLWVATAGRPSASVFKQLLAVLLTALGTGSALAIVVSRGLARSNRGSPRAAMALAALVLPSFLPWCFTSLLLLELSLGLESAARIAVAGVSAGDLRPGMTLALSSALAVALLTANCGRFAAFAATLETRPALLEVGGSRRRRARFAALAWFGVLLAIGLSSLRSGAGGELSAIVRSLALFACVTTGSAGLLGLGLGALRGRRQRSLDSLLARAVEVQAALPAVIWAAAFGVLLGGGLRFALALGALRALDIAWVYRTELARASFEDRGGYAEGRRPTSAHPTPVPPSNRSRVAFTGPALAALALTPAWALALSTGVAALGLSPAQAGWGLLAISPAVSPVVAAAALLLSAITTAALLTWLAPLPRKLGALRTSWLPPVEHFPTEPPPSEPAPSGDLRQRRG
jgi:peptide/nickel transport system permease protein